MKYLSEPTVPKKNSELLQLPFLSLSHFERSKYHVLSKNLAEMPCPLCEYKQNVFQAAKIEIDEFSFSERVHKYKCVSCDAVLKYVVPLQYFSPGWKWAVCEHWIRANMVRKVQV